MEKTLLIFFILLFSFCSKRESNLPRIIIPDVDNVVEVNTKHMLQSKPELLIFNFIKDTNALSKKELCFDKSVVDLKKDTLLPRYDLKIIIDTTYNFHSKDFEYKWYNLAKTWDSISKLKHDRKDLEELIDKNYYSKIDKLRKHYVEAYPLLIFNKSNENAYLKEIRLSNFSMIQEAKDIDGKWKPIEFSFSLPCDILSYDFYKLLPKKYFATSIIKYYGNFKTKIRVKIRFGRNYYYSNEIVGSINRSQFNTDFINAYLKIYKGVIDETYFPTVKEGMLLQRKY